MLSLDYFVRWLQFTCWPYWSKQVLNRHRKIRYLLLWSVRSHEKNQRWSGQTLQTNCKVCSGAASIHESCEVMKSMRWHPWHVLLVAERRQREASTENTSLKVTSQFLSLCFVLHITPPVGAPLHSSNLPLLSLFLIPLCSSLRRFSPFWYEHSWIWKPY